MNQLEKGMYTSKDATPPYQFLQGLQPVAWILHTIGIDEVVVLVYQRKRKQLGASCLMLT